MRQNVQITVGDVASSVSVEAKAPVVQSDTSSIGSVVDNPQIQTIPLNGRSNINSLLTITPVWLGPAMTNPSRFALLFAAILLAACSKQPTKNVAQAAPKSAPIVIRNPADRQIHFDHRIAQPRRNRQCQL